MQKDSDEGTILAGPNRVQVCKWNGWGFTDTYLYESDTSARLCSLTSNVGHRINPPHPGSSSSSTTSIGESLQLSDSPAQWWQLFVERQFGPPIIDENGEVVSANDIELEFLSMQEARRAISNPSPANGFGSTNELHPQLPEKTPEASSSSSSSEGVGLTSCVSVQESDGSPQLYVVPHRQPQQLRLLRSENAYRLVPHTASAGQSLSLQSDDNHNADNDHASSSVSASPQSAAASLASRRFVVVSGNRYWFSGKVMKPFGFIETISGFTPLRTSPPQPELKVPSVGQLHLEFLHALEKVHSIVVSQSPAERLFHAHGHTISEIFTLRYGRFSKVPDCVIYPATHEEVEVVVRLARQYDVVLIPFGGGTSVTKGLCCPSEETRIIASLDVSRLNRILWVDHRNLVACLGAGVVGEHLDRQLRKLGLTLGHEPDSKAFSTVGGWIATRCSGMKKSTYGNIENLLVAVTIVTPSGTFTTPNTSGLSENSYSAQEPRASECDATKQNADALLGDRNSCVTVPRSSPADRYRGSSSSSGKCYPRVSGGPDPRHIVLGSEGILGVITQAVLRLSPLPEIKRYGSIAFPNFNLGVQFVEEVAKRRIQPTSIRLMDNMQFRFGAAMKPKDPKDFETNRSLRRPLGNNSSSSLWSSSFFSALSDWLLDRVNGRGGSELALHADTLWDAAKRFYLFNVKAFDEREMVGVTLLFEGDKKKVDANEKEIYQLSRKYRGLPGGSRAGEQGYNLTFLIAYIRDFVMDFNWVFESFETSISWDRTVECCARVKARVAQECRALHVRHAPVVMIRVAQVYSEGPCLYFYMGFNWIGLSNPMRVYEQVEERAREVIMDCGGCISHHHGVGKLRKRFMKRHTGSIGTSLLSSVKAQLDPTNVFGNGNLI